MSLPTIAGVQSRIHTLPDQPPFMIIREMAEALGFDPASLRRTFHRNKGKFPAGYFFVLTPEEYKVQSRQSVTTAERSPTDLEQYAFTEKGTLFLLRFVTGEQADAGAIMLIDAFSALRDTQLSALRREWVLDRDDYIHRSKLRQRIATAAAEGWSYSDLIEQFGYSNRELTVAIDRMRTRGYIAAHALAVPMHVLEVLKGKKAALDAQLTSAVLERLDEIPLQADSDQPSLFVEDHADV